MFYYKILSKKLSVLEQMQMSLLEKIYRIESWIFVINCIIPITFCLSLPITKIFPNFGGA